ncbi:TPA: XkdX family protein [Clostridium sporogenes]
MFNFYNTFYKNGYLKLEIVMEACKWNVITKEEFKEVTGEDFVTQ